MNHPVLEGYMGLNKEAAWYHDLAKKLGDAMKAGNFKGIDTKYLTAGGGGILGAIMGALMSPNNRVLGALGGGLAGGGAGYLGGYLGADKIKDWGKGISNYGRTGIDAGNTAKAQQTIQDAQGQPAYAQPAGQAPVAPMGQAPENALVGLQNKLNKIPAPMQKLQSALARTA